MISLIDFAVLPPEINSARMYAGVGSGPLVAAAQAWDGLAAELNSTAAFYRAVVAELTAGQWVGPSSTSMAAAAAPYVSWLTATGAVAAQTASQLRSAVAAYEVAYVATVPPAEIEVNRALLAALVATNMFGQNSSAIAATEARYAQMWAQDAAAMYSYAGASAAATTLTPFNEPTQHTNPAQAIAAAMVPALLDTLGSPAVHVFESLIEGTLGLGTLSYGANFLVSGVMLTAAPMIAVCFNPLAAALSAPATAVSAVPEGALGPTLVGSYGSEVGALPSAGLSQAASVGKLSVPPSWITKSPEIRLAATASAFGPMAPTGLPATAAGGSYSGMPLVGPVTSVVNAPRGARSSVRSGMPAKVVAGPDEELCFHPNRRGPDDLGPAGDPPSERDELHQLRKAAAQLARQRDVLKRTAATIIQEATEK